MFIDEFDLCSIQALTIHFQSYMGKMKMVLAVDETVIPDPHQLCMDLSDSLDSMKKAVVGVQLEN